MDQSHLETRVVLKGVPGMSETYLSRVGNLGPIVEFIEHAGGRTKRVFSSASLSPDICSQHDLLIPQRDVFLILEQAARELDDPTFGVELGSMLTLDDLGQFGDLLSLAPTLRAAINLAGAKVCSLVQEGTELKLDTSKRNAVWSYRSHERAAIGREQDGIISLGFMLTTVRAFAGQEWMPTAVIVSESARPIAAALEIAYETDVVCRGEYFSLLFDNDLLSLSNAKRETSSAVLKSLRANMSIPTSKDMVSIARKMCELELTIGLPRLERVAGRMGVLPRTLQRRLRERGTSFRSLSLGAIMKQADSLVMNSSWPITRIAVHLGYAETSQFSRAYRKWTGASPAEMRRLVMATIPIGAGD